MTKITIDGKEYTPEEIAALSKAGVLTTGAKHDASSTTPTGIAPYGPLPGDNTLSGPFSSPGVRPDMYSAVPQEPSIGDIVPMFPSDIFNELIEIATGVTAASGSNSTSSGTVGARSGLIKVAKQVYTFGIIHMATKIYDRTQTGMRTNRASVDRNLYNAAGMMNRWLPQPDGITGTDFVASTLRQELYPLGTNLNNAIGAVHFAGVSGTEDDTYLGVARQWAGLDALIKTGYTDSATGLAAPALDSLVSQFGVSIDGTDANGQDFVGALTGIVYGLKERDSKIAPGATVNRALVMRGDLFREAALQFAYARNLSSGPGTATAPMFRDSFAVQMDFERQLNGRFLLVDGMPVPVVIDDHIPRETVGNRQHKSDIYYPALAMNGRPLLYAEYFDMGNADATEFANAFGIGSSDEAVINRGMYMVFQRKTGGILEYDFFARPRLILDAPNLSGRLDDVVYTLSYTPTDATPGDSYYVNGGVTYRT